MKPDMDDGYLLQPRMILYIYIYRHTLKGKKYKLADNLIQNLHNFIIKK